MDTVVDSHQIAIAGITEVIHGIPRVYRAFHQLLMEADRRHPQLAILIDFPDFNLRLAGKLSRATNSGGLLREPAGFVAVRTRAGAVHQHVGDGDGV